MEIHQAKVAKATKRKEEAENQLAALQVSQTSIINEQGQRILELENAMKAAQIAANGHDETPLDQNLLNKMAPPT